MARTSKSKRDVYTNDSIHLISKTDVVEAKSRVRTQKRKVEAEEPLYIDRM